MSEGPPRRLIEEMITRWFLTRERAVIVEGADDVRLLQLLQREENCAESFGALDIWPSDALEISAAMVSKHGLNGAGAKQRVIAFAREVEQQGEADGFRGVVDRDLDECLSIDHRSAALLYTDYGCMDAYVWTPEVLRRLLVQFRCDGKCGSVLAVRRLYASIGATCAALAAVRVSALRHPEWALSLHHSDKALSVPNAVLQFDLAKYLSQCQLRGPDRPAVEAEVARANAEIGVLDPLSVVNGHDLLWLTVFCLKSLTSLSRRSVDEQVVAGALVSFGTMDPRLPRQPLFDTLATWAAA